jgi:hypothetical protein
MLSGYKTYITAVLAILAAIGTWLAGDLQLADMIQTVVTAALGAFIRHGVATEAAKSNGA